MSFADSPKFSLRSCFAALLLSSLLGPAAALRAAEGWGTSTVKVTELESNATAGASTFAWSYTKNGCRVAKVELDRHTKFLVRLDGKPVGSYTDVVAPVFSPEGTAFAFAALRDWKWMFVVDGKEGPLFDEVVPQSFVFSNDGKRHAYLARQDGNLIAVVDGRIENVPGVSPWESPLAFSADGRFLAYVARAPVRGMTVVVNGRSGAVYDDLGIPRFSRNGARLVYPAFSSSEAFYVVDGKEGIRFEMTQVDFAFSPDGKRSAYVARRGEQRFLVVDGAIDSEIDGIVDYTLTFSPDGKRIAYGGIGADDERYIVIDGKKGPEDDGIGIAVPPGLTGAPPPGVLFSPDSRRLAYVARKDSKLRVVVDGKEDAILMDGIVGASTTGFDQASGKTKLVARGLVFSPDSARLAYGCFSGRKQFYAINGVKDPEYTALGPFDFSPDSKHYAYAAIKEDRTVVVVDGIERAEYDSAPGGLVFREDGVLEFLAFQDKKLLRVEVTNLP